MSDSADVVQFVFDESLRPVDDASAFALLSRLEATGSTDWRVDFTRSATGEEASEYTGSALEALELADDLFRAEPPMIATLVPLFPQFKS